jgi:hypothetical protein
VGCLSRNMAWWQGTGFCRPAPRFLRQLELKRGTHPRPEKVVSWSPLLKREPGAPPRAARFRGVPPGKRVTLVLQSHFACLRSAGDSNGPPGPQRKLGIVQF